MKYSVVIPFNTEDIFVSETESLSEARGFAIDSAESYGVSYVVENYKGIEENWILECDGKNFRTM